jgi:ribosome biogenesis GTPase / thiamine phosphate phosphatase
VIPNDLSLTIFAAMKGLVLKSTGKNYEVITDDGRILQAQVRGKLRLKGLSTTNPIAAGDRVELEFDTEASALIAGIEERKNYIIRKSVNLSKEAQIVAANIDRAFLLITVKRPQTTPGFIDRFLATAEAYRIESVLLFHKYDQYDVYEKEDADALRHVYERIGYTCLCTSLITGEGLSEVQSLLKNKVSLFSGHSGVGKSSIINHFVPGKDIRVGDISEASSKGQHTTTFSEMHALAEGGYVVDTPGIKGFGLVDIPKDELHHYFREFFALLSECKFHNCLHLNEPGCAVRQGVEEGTVAESRYRSYVNMYADEDDRSPYR